MEDKKENKDRKRIGFLSIFKTTIWNLANGGVEEDIPINKKKEANFNATIEAITNRENNNYKEEIKVESKELNGKIISRSKKIIKSEKEIEDK